MSRRKLDEQQFASLVQQSTTVAEVIRGLGKSLSGSSYRFVHQHVRQFGLDTSHWLGQAHLKGKTHEWAPSHPLPEILVKNSRYSNTHMLKLRLIKNGLLNAQCAICGIDKWLGKNLSLHLDHINGISDDNRLENLRILCPNCHSQTATYCAKNIKIRRTRTHLCSDCKRSISRGATLCKSCAGKKAQHYKILWPPIEQLLEEVTKTSFLATGKRLGVSDNAVRKHIRNHNSSK